MSFNNQPMYQRKKSNHNNTHANNNNNNNNNTSNGNMYGRSSNGFNDIEGGRMRSTGGGGGHQRNNNNNGKSSSSINDTNANILEQQNNERMNELANHVALLKGLTIEIGNEVREQNSLLDNMNDGFVNTRDLLQNSLRRISTMLESGGTKHMCYMVLFCIGIMMLLWWLMSSSK